MKKTKIFIFAIVGAIIVVLLLFAYGLLFGKKGVSPLGVSAALDMWGVFDGGGAYKTAFSRFNQFWYPNVTVRYRQFDSVEHYEQTLLDALAAGTGPDIFMVRNNDLARKMNKIFPLPAERYSLLDLRRDFPEIVEENFAPTGSIYALPISVDTLALLYNHDLFNEAAIVYTPTTWEEFQEAVPKLVSYGDDDGISQAAAALGGAGNIENVKDILSFLMLQGGTRMINDTYSKALFASEPGLNALRFYIQFADKNSEVFTWDGKLPNSLDAFAEGKVAMIFDYSSAIQELRERNPFISVVAALAPQLEGTERKIAYANYWGYTVSRQSTNLTIAWDFVRFLTTDWVSGKSYIDATGRPPALRGLINEYLTDPELNVFASQALIAKSWPEPNPDGVSKIFSGMIEDVITGEGSPLEALEEAEAKVTGLMGRRF